MEAARGAAIAVSIALFLSIPTTAPAADSSGAAGADTLADGFDRGLAALKADAGSAYHELIDQWLGRDSVPPRSTISLPPWAQWTLLGLALLALLTSGALLLLYLRMRKRRAELAERTRMLDASQRMASVGSWKLDVRTYRLDWSDETYRIFGASPRTPDHPTSRGVLARVHPEDRDRVRHARELALNEGRAFDIEYRLVRPDGEVRTVRSIAVPEKDMRGRVIVLNGTMADVTEQREAERRNELYRRMLEASQDEFCVIDEQGRYVTMTSGYARTNGIDRDAAEGAPLSEVFDCEFLEREVWPPLKRCLAGEEQHFEGDRETADGERRRVLVHYFPVPGAHEGVRMVGISISDLTAFHRATTELREQARLIELAGRLARLGGFRVELDDDRVIWSDMVAEIHGHAYGHSVSMQEDLAFLAPEHRERIETAFRACAEQGIPYDEEVQVIAPDGGRIWTREVGQPVRDDSGRIIAVEGAFQDIDAIKRGEERLSQYRALIEGSDELCGIADQDYRYVLVNDAYARWHGRSKEEIEGATVASVIGSEYFESQFAEVSERVLAGESVQFETVRTRADGLRRTLLMRFFPLRSPTDGSPLIALLMTDVTDSRQIESELGRQRRLAEMAGRVAGVGGWSVDRHGRIEWSAITATIHAQPPDHVPDRAEALNYFVDDSRARIEALLEGCLERGDAYEADLEIVDAAGLRRWVRTVGEPFRDEDGAIAAVQGALRDVTAEKNAECERERLNQRLANILESITDAFLTVDHEWTFQYVNTEAGRLLGYPAEDMVGRNAWAMFPAGLGTPFEDAFRRTMESGQPVTVEEYYEPRHVWFKVRVYPYEDGLALYFQDVTERRRVLQQLREQEEALRWNRDELAGLLKTRQALINALPAHIALLDHEGTVLDVNEQWRHFGRAGNNPDPHFGVGSNYLAVCDAASGDCGEEALDAAEGIRAVLRGDRETFALEYPCHPPGGEQWFRVMVTEIRSSPDGDVGAVVMHIDITERKQAERQLRRLAYEDPLTGLLSRSGIVQAIERHIEERGQKAADTMIMLDLEGQRDINDVHGFEAGDHLLASVGERLVSVLPEDAVVGRTGGDEFAVFVPASGEVSAAAYRDVVNGAFGEPFQLADGRIEVGAHFGYVEVGQAVHAPESLLREAELALFRCRELGDVRWTAYTPDLDAASQHRIETTRELRRALANDELRLYFHPKVALDTGELIEAEALLRWEHPDRGLLPPGLFIPVAEQSQLIGPMGDWALRDACRLLREWHADGLEIVRISVNISVVQLTIGDFASTVAEVIESYGIDPGALTLEITESVFERESERLHEQLERISALGVRLSLDDFGTGYSSLLYLQRYPFDEIKIDQGFVRHMLEDEYSHRIVMTVIALANALGAEVVAEGIENGPVGEALRALGCRVGQGYYYSVPLASEDFRWLLEQRSTLPLRVGGGFD